MTPISVRLKYSILISVNIINTKKSWAPLVFSPWFS